MGVGRFEDLIAWQKARVLTWQIYGVTRQGAFARDYGLARQIQRAAVSIMSNIAEGYERNSPREFRRYLMIAKGSCAELRSQLYVAFEIQYLDQVVHNRLHALAEEVARIIGGLAASTERRGGER